MGGITLFCIHRALCPKAWQEVFGWGSMKVVRKDGKKLGSLPHPMTYNNLISI